MDLKGTNDTIEVTDALYRSGPDDDQMGKWSLMMAFWAISSAIFMLYIGAAMAMAYGTRDALIGIALTIVVYSLINRVLTKYSLNNRATVVRFSRTILGKSGTVITSIILALTAMYYSVFEGVIVVHSFQAAFGGETWFWSLFVVAYSTPLILGGVRRFLDKFNGWLMPLYFIGLIVVVVWAGVQYGFTDTWLTQGPDTPLPLSGGGPGWLATFAAYMGVWVLLMYTMDYAALGKRKDTKFHVRATFTWPFWTITYGLNAVVGIFITFTIPGVDASETGIAGGLVGMMGILGLLLVLVFQTRINTANYYIGAANLQEFGERLFKVRLPAAFWVLLSSAIIFALMLLPIVEYLLIALAWQGVLVTGWISIALTHIYMNRSRKPEHGMLQDEHYRRFSTPGMTAWIVATAAGIILTSAFPWGITWGPIATVVLASGLYAVLSVTLGQRTALIVPAQSTPRSELAQNAPS
ncbi:cytosine permease [uncultured Citricoccus sp.]|uniref:purine-cytosine permease family protein n=1 Tax=uncultured Citricoccus sp. TaxID=614031 RepID=UPI0026092964|nr:permease [uncultured Citricoccus sp.]